jgi:peptide/nickel transport system ATP-binding protein
MEAATMAGSVKTGPQPVVSVADLYIRFTTPRATVHAVNGISFDLEPGRVLGILGESGSGKSVTLRALMGLLPAQRARIEGHITVAGNDITRMDERALREVRGSTIAMIFQEPMTALDPVFTIGEQIAETIVRHEALSYQAAYRRALDLLDMVQIPSAARRLRAYPHEISGGMRQRAMIALALSCRQVQQKMGMAVIFVTHDVGVAAEVSDRLAVMYAGRFVETGPAETVIEAPAHPYTAGLLASTVLGSARGQRLQAIPGIPPDLGSLPPGCSFAARCRFVEERCREVPPSEFALSATHMVRCGRVAAGEIEVAKPSLADRLHVD